MLEWLLQLIDPIINPKKRVFIGYLFAALALACLWLYWRKGTALKQSIKQVFSRQIWLSRSSAADAVLIVGNHALFVLITPFLITQVTMANQLYIQWFGLFGMPPVQSGWADWQVMAAFTLVLFLLDDFSRFFLHWLLHKVPFLWAFHQVHHSATSMTPFTVLRTHPVEGVLFYLRSASVQALVISFFIYFFGDQVDLIDVLGISVVVFAFNLLGSNLRHSHIAIYYPKWLERWLVSPAMHQIHHSTLVRHFDKNMGSILSVWDRLFGTFHHSEPQIELKFGVNAKQSATHHRLLNLYLSPFLQALTALPFIRKKHD